MGWLGRLATIGLCARDGWVVGMKGGTGEFGCCWVPAADAGMTERWRCWLGGGAEDPHRFPAKTPEPASPTGRGLGAPRLPRWAQDRLTANGTEWGAPD